MRVGPRRPPENGRRCEADRGSFFEQAKNIHGLRLSSFISNTGCSQVPFCHVKRARPFFERKLNLHMFNEWSESTSFFTSSLPVSHTLWQLDFLHFLTSTQCPSRPRRCKLPAPREDIKVVYLFNIFLLLSHCMNCTERNASEKQEKILNGIRREVSSSSPLFRLRQLIEDSLKDENTASHDISKE